ncbi:MAG: hypothetical protein IT426_16145 [Pirellulales bacterium]|nr:hypothetical protein [Pirellulales bacterium]
MNYFFAPMLFAISTAGLLRAEELAKSVNAEGNAATNCVSVDKLATGENVLLVRYPWRIHEKASIEVRLISEKSEFAARVRPLRFATLRFDPTTERRIYGAFDNALVRHADWNAEAGGLDWRIIARGNHLGRAAAWFVNVPKKESSLIGTAAAFGPLESWAIGDRLLMLDLPRESSDPPGKLHIWFLRGEKILWREELTWPGRIEK